MIKSDFRYIIKRILIGVGICVCLSFLNSCNVKAADYGVYLGSFGFDTSPYYQDFYFDTDNLKLVQVYSNDNNIQYDYNIPSDYKYVVYNTGVLSSGQKFFQRLTFSDSSLYLREGTNNKILQCSTLPCHMIRFDVNAGGRLSVSNYTYTSNSTNMIYISNKGGNSNTVIHTNSDLYLGSTLYQEKNLDLIIQDSTSTINSLGVVKNKNQEENVITSYTFHPTFTNFNTDNFTYQYKIGDNNWLNITSNNVSFNVNQNTTVYFRVLKKSDNTVIDSQTYTITNILKYNDNVNDDYNVKYTSENKSVQEDSSINRTIDTVTVNFEYFPKQSNLKYQYQYVNTGDSLSSWVDMPNNDYERGYSVNVNGTMHNRILDENDNVLYTSTFTVDSIGKLMFDSDISWYNSLFSKINYGSGIGTIFYLPLKIVQTVHDSYSENCSPVNLGSLFGTTLYMPCIDIKSLIGSNLYNIIDVIFMGFIALSIIRFIVNIYNRIISLNFEGNEDGSGALFL